MDNKQKIITINKNIPIFLVVNNDFTEFIVGDGEANRTCLNGFIIYI